MARPSHRHKKTGLAGVLQSLFSRRRKVQSSINFKMSKRYILVVPGSFAPPNMYNVLTTRVKKRGYEIKALHLPSVGLAPGEGRPTPASTLYEDAAFIAKEVEALADAGREVVVVAHSYGGMPTTESTKGLSVQERKKQGKTGGLARLAYSTVLLTKPGYAPMETPGLRPPDESMKLIPDEMGWLHMPDLEQVAALSFSDIPKEDGLRWSAKFALHSGVSFVNKLTYPGYKDVPVSYLVFEDDLVITPDAQRTQIKFLEEDFGIKVDVASIRSAHCPTTSAALDRWTDWIVDAAEK